VEAEHDDHALPLRQALERAPRVGALVDAYVVGSVTLVTALRQGGRGLLALSGMSCSPGRGCPTLPVSTV